MKTDAAFRLLADTFKALGDPTRIRIAFALSREELCVCDLANLLGVSQSVVSHSLRVLREMQLVKFRKEGKIAYYTLDDEHIEHLLDEGFRHVEELLD
ncbi:MAG: winged helix-turn-helix transcriptional regulator [Pyrinomonadaceae bacterium]|nr:winged helix-turn-helix transcriptional regulator [Acidobacteriota bacterium]MBP9109234.1 winged helix-turn-helix transcriptional regulator [Pyrinomonadaceae bacterium]